MCYMEKLYIYIYINDNERYKTFYIKYKYNMLIITQMILYAYDLCINKYIKYVF